MSFDWKKEYSQVGHDWINESQSGFKQKAVLIWFFLKNNNNNNNNNNKVLSLLSNGSSPQYQVGTAELNVAAGATPPFLYVRNVATPNEFEVGRKVVVLLCF